MFSACVFFLVFLILLAYSLMRSFLPPHTANFITENFKHSEFFFSVKFFECSLVYIDYLSIYTHTHIHLTTETSCYGA